MTQTELAIPAPADMQLGLAGSWLVGPLLALRADAPCGPVEAVWFADVTPQQWRELAGIVWAPDGRRRPSATIGQWFRVRDRIVAPCGPAVVALAAWLAPVVAMPGATCRRVEVAGQGYVLVSVDGAVVAVVAEMRVEAVR